MDENIIKALPPMLKGEDLDAALRILPSYDEHFRQMSITERLIALQDIYSVYIPSLMSREIYTRLYLSLVRSLQKKRTLLATRQLSENSRRIRQQHYESIIGGADAFTIIGTSGIGKTSAISRATSILMEKPILEIDECKLITCLSVQCPADVSVKGLLLEVLRKADETLGSKYYNEAIRAKSTLDVLIGSVSQVALNHIAVLIIDEIQNIVVHKNGRGIIGTLTQLINSSGVAVVMVGTPDCEPFFASEMILARRSVGLSYREMKYDEEYKLFVSLMMKYNYTQSHIECNEALYLWLYSHSGGNRSITVQLIHDGQEIAIMSGSEQLDIALLTQAFEQRLTLLHDFIVPERKKYASSRKTQKQLNEINVSAELPNSISEISLLAKRTNSDVVAKLKENGILVSEIVL